MKIIDKRPGRKVKVSDIKPGDGFEHDGKIYIRIEDHSTILSSVCLYDNKIVFLFLETRVTPVDLEVTVNP